MNDDFVAGAWLSRMFEGLLGIFFVISFHRGHMFRIISHTEDVWDVLAV